ncbi:MAG: AMP-binding protein [Nitrospinae bacterium]|nr:AMP-binding protein [Nitrospinota bacterium]
MALEFYNLIKTHAEKSPDHPAIIDGGSTITYGQLLEQTERFAGALSGLDLKPHSKLGLLCLNQKEYLVALMGAFLKGLPVIPYNFLLTPEDLVYVTRDAGIDIVIADSAFIKPETVPFIQSFKSKIVVGDADITPLGESTHSFESFLKNGDRSQAHSRHEKDASIPDVILYTSGTTAKPKGVMLDESQFAANCRDTLAHIPITSADRVTVALPLFHSFGNIMALIVFMAGGTLILLKQFAPKAILHSIGEHKATILPLVPTIYSFLVDLYGRGGYDVSSLKYCISGGAALPRALLKKVEATLQVSVIEGYGLTETSPVIALNTFKDGSVPGSVGPVVPSVEVKIVDDAGKEKQTGDVGEILVRGKTVMRGYWKHPAETAETITTDGWLKTGDLGHLDADNRLYISAGRKKDLIIRAGENVSPLAIENALMNHPAIAEVAAVGVPDERAGERVKVCVVLRQGTSATEIELKKFCRENLPAFMSPDYFQFFEELPKTATGKILKSELRKPTS